MVRVSVDDSGPSACAKPADVVALPRYAGAPASTFCRRRGFLARAGQIVAEPSGDGSVVLNVGLGAAGSATPATFRAAAAAAVRAAGPARTLRLDLALPDGPVPPAERARAVTEGALLALYRYDTHRSRKPARTLDELIVAVPQPEARAAVREAQAVSNGTCLARDLVNAPPGELTPTLFADRARQLAEEYGFSCTVHEGGALAELGLAGLSAVGRGSREAAKYVEIDYAPEGAPGAPAVGLVGKGVTFDSGGLSLKQAREMHTMKSDMGGAAAVVGALASLARLALPVRVRSHLPLTENMPGGAALRSGDIVRHLDGTTTEIVNTDNEGRLVLADVLVHAGRARPDLLIDVATLTSAAAHALGTRTGALFANDEQLAETVLSSADRTGEPLCRLPLAEDERRHLHSATADRVNCSYRYGDTTQAALFLQDFVPTGMLWAHLDIAAPAHNDEPPYREVPHGGTGFGVRTLVETLRRVSGGEQAPDPPGRMSR